MYTMYNIHACTCVLQYLYLGYTLMSVESFSDGYWEEEYMPGFTMHGLLGYGVAVHMHWVGEGGRGLFKYWIVLLQVVFLSVLEK